MKKIEELIEDAYKNKIAEIEKMQRFTANDAQALYYMMSADYYTKKYSHHSEDNSINDELKDVEKYYNKYQSTKDSDYLMLAKDELKHAKILSNKLGLDKQLSDKIEQWSKILM